MIADLFHIAAQVSSRSASASTEEVSVGAEAAPDPEAVLRALIDRRMGEARQMGEALARRVLAETLGSKDVRLALAVLREGTDADHRLVDLCEIRLQAAAEVQRQKMRPTWITSST